ncbi:MAG: Rieske (2Fe-2S) protein [Anaerolineales bacterium]|nr:Rieske (2Fe-2S) protein [Anaerolineales bacterium]
MSEKIKVGQLSDFTPGKINTVSVKGNSVLVVRLEDGRVCAVKNQCAHLPLPLNRGSIDGDSITCPWHGSKFNVCSGKNIDWVMGVAGVKMPDWSRRLIALGRDAENLTTYGVEIEDGDVFVVL